MSNKHANKGEFDNSITLEDLCILNVLEFEAISNKLYLIYLKAIFYIT